MAKLLERPYLKIAVQTISSFIEDRGLKLSAALAYYTVFSLAPMLLLLISLAGIFLGKEAIEGKLFYELNGLLGSEAALQIQQMIQGVELAGKSNVALAIGLATLFIGATTIFAEIQDSINQIWKVKAKPKKSWLKFLRDRLLSGSVIISLGFLLVVSLIINGAILAIMDRLAARLADVTVFLASLVNNLVSFVIITILFGTIFKVLPDAKIKWKDVRTGALFTTCLFFVGRYIIGLYIAQTATGSAFGAAGSLIVVLVWVYYTAAILYLGAEFTQVYAEYKGEKIAPSDYAVAVVHKEIEKEVDVLPPQHDQL